MDIYRLRDIIGQEIVDYNQLKNALKSYAHPRGKIAQWLNSGDLIRVKKGLYVFGPAVARQAYSVEVIANLIYGPSTISLTYALSYYGLIPERVPTVTSITNKRNKEFNTPIGRFTYRYLHSDKYAIGTQLLSTREGMNFLIAKPEKALCDFIMLSAKNVTLTSQQQLESFILDDLRMDEDNLKALDKHLMTEIAECYRNKRLNQFMKHFTQWIK